MKRIYKKYIIVLGLIAASSAFTFAAKLEIIAPERANHTSDPVMVQVTLDPESDVVSGIAGDLSYPSELFDVHSISTDGSVVSPWVLYPNIKDGEYLDGKTHITFEGIFAGGFGGVKSAYYAGKKTGSIFTVILLPKKEGSGVISLDNITLNSFDERATPLPVHSQYSPILVPDLISNAILPGKVIKLVKPKSLSVSVERSELVHMGAWYLTVYDSEPKSAIEDISIIETDDAGITDRDDTRWKKIMPPYILFYQDRSKFMHVKVEYSNGAYAFKTIAPVENLQLSSAISRILSGVLLLCLLYVFYVYLNNHVRFFSKKHSKKDS